MTTDAWTPAEVEAHRRDLMDAIRGPLNVAHLVASAPKDEEVDWVAVERVCHGRLEHLNHAEKLEAVRYMRGHRVSPRVMQDRLRVSGTTMARLLREVDLVSTGTSRETSRETNGTGSHEGMTTIKQVAI